MKLASFLLDRLSYCYIFVEEYQDIGLGESCLVLGFSENIPIHAVAGWRGEKVAIITVYIPQPPKFIDPWTRRKRDDQKM